MNIEGRTIRLRAVEPGDVDLMYEWENDCDIWPVSGTTEPVLASSSWSASSNGIRTSSGCSATDNAADHRDAVEFQAGRGDRPVRIRPDPPAGQASASSSTNRATGDAATPPTPWKPSAATHTIRCARISCGATSVPTTKRACACSAARDSPRSASNATGYGGPTAITTR